MLLADLISPNAVATGAKLLQLSILSEGCVALYSNNAPSSDRPDASASKETMFIMDLSDRERKIYDAPGTVVYKSHDLCQICRYFNGELHIDTKVASHAYTSTKVYQLLTYTPKFATPITLSTGQRVLVVIGILTKRPQSVDVSRYFSECCNSDPVKIAAAYSFFYILNYDTGEQINSFLIPIKRKNRVINISYDNAGFIHIFYLNSQDTVLKLLVKPLEFYNLLFTKDTVSLLDSRGEYIRPLSPPTTLEFLQLKALRASRVNISELRFTRLNHLGVTIHILCDYVKAECVYLVYKEVPGLSELHILAKDVLTTSTITVSPDQKIIYYVSVATEDLRVTETEAFIERIIDKEESYITIPSTVSGGKLFPAFCTSSVSASITISQDDFEEYKSILEVLGSKQSSHKEIDTVAEQNTLANDLDQAEFSHLSESTDINISQRSLEESDLELIHSSIQPQISASSYDEIVKRISALEAHMRTQHSDYKKIVKELEDFYDTVGQLVDKQTRLSKKLDEHVCRNMTGTVLTESNNGTPTCSQSQSLKTNLKALCVISYQILIGLIGCVVTAIKWVKIKVSERQKRS